MDNQQDKLDKRADNRQDMLDRRADNRQDKLDNRQDRRIYKRGEFKERFQDNDRERIVTYFSGHRGRDHGLPPGLVRVGDNGRRLPSGWRDRLTIGFVIDTEWQPALQPVPYDWFPEITVVPDTRLYFYGDRLVRVYEPTHEVVDVIVIPTIQTDL